MRTDCFPEMWTMSVTTEVKPQDFRRLRPATMNTLISFLPSIASTRERTRAKHVFMWRQTSEFQVSNFQVFTPKCEVLLLDTAQRKDDSNQQKGRNYQKGVPLSTICIRTCAGLFFLRSWAKIRLLPAFDCCWASGNQIVVHSSDNEQCSAVVVSWEDPPNTWLTAAKNAFVGWAFNFRVRVLLKSAANTTLHIWAGKL